jgi:hypothetical protein
MQRDILGTKVANSSRDFLSCGTMYCGGVPTFRRILLDLGKHSEDGGSKVFGNIVILPQYYTASQPKDLDLNLHRRGNLKSLEISEC